MPTRPALRRLAVVPAAIVLAAVLAACGSDATTPAVPSGSTPGPTSSPTPSSPAPSVEPSSPMGPTPVPGGSTTPSPGPVSTTSTEWGVILDAVPADFPVFPGAGATEPIDGPASAAFVAPAGPAEVSEWYQAALEQAGYSTVAMSGPFEDGSLVIESLGPSSDCRVETTIRPLSGTTLVLVMYGAGCAA